MGIFQTIVNQLSNHFSQPQILFTLHADPDNVLIGGTEAHVRQCRELLLQHNYAVLIVAPVGKNKFILRGMYKHGVFLEETLHQDCLPALISVLESYVDVLQVHHTMGWPTVALDALANSRIKLKLATAHDFYFLCPSISLLSELHPERFCDVEQDLQKCNTCLATKWRRSHESIQQYRQLSLHFLEKFKAILVPSASVLSYFQRAYGEQYQNIASKIHVFPHDLSYLSGIVPSNAKSITKNKISFIGALDSRKGSVVLLEAIPLLQKAGFEVEILGCIFPRYHPNLKHVNIKPYKTPKELAQLLSVDGGPKYLGFISICPETFSYTFFEGLWLCPTAIPIVGPYGNPAAICHQTKIGPVMKACSPDALLEALQEAEANHVKYSKALSEYIKILRESTQHRSYFAEYQNFIGPVENVSLVAPDFPPEYLSQISFQNAASLKRDATFSRVVRWKLKRVRHIFQRIQDVGWLTALRHLRGML